MLRRSILLTALATGLASWAGFGSISAQHVRADSPQPQPQPHPGSGKGKGRPGARKPYHAPRHTQRHHGKPARRRRRAAALRRG